MATRIKRRYRRYDNRSVYQALAAVHLMLAANGHDDDWLGECVEPILKGNPLLARGITRPKKYQEFTP